LNVVYLFYMTTMTTFAALAEPLRRQILDLVREQPRNVGELAELLKITQPNVSKHLAVLRDVGLVRVRQESRLRWYELNPEPLAEIEAWLAPYRQYMEAKYDRLDELLNELDDPDESEE
jgi:DNA-binding transcriptional ArsR family regulator